MNAHCRPHARELLELARFATHPMFSTTTKMFGALLVMARVQWRPPDFQNNTIHRGVTLYQPG